MENKKIQICVQGMTCRSCEILIEKSLKKVPGVSSVKINCATGKGEVCFEGEACSLETLEQALPDKKYSLKDTAITREKPSLLTVVGLFALVFVLGFFLSRLGLFSTNFQLTGQTTFGAVFLIGLVAASSSCIAVVGGLLLSTSARFNEKYVLQRPIARMRPVVLFVLGRIVSYTVLGGLLGLLGGFLSLPPLLTALITLIASLYMLIMGLEMLHIAPSWMKRILPTSKTLSHKIMNGEENGNFATPFLLGSATFFLPCGFTQALQLYALTTGSFVTGALLLLAFALGTAPALFALGFASNSLKGKLGKWFFQFSGALVVILGVWNIGNAFSLAGYPITLFSSNVKNESREAGMSIPKGDVQVVKMQVDSLRGYIPSNLTVIAGKPVRWEVDGTNANGCANVLVSRKFGIQKVLQPGINVIEFTPTEPGTVAFSCSMGMYRGSFTVVPAKS